MSNPVSVVPVKEWSPAFVQSSARVGSSSGRDIDQTLAIVTTGNWRPSEVRYENYSLSSKPAQAITPIILGNAASKRVAPVDVLIGKLQEGDPLWQELFAVLQSKPETLAELSLLGYVFTILRPALQRGGRYGPQSNQSLH